MTRRYVSAAVLRELLDKTTDSDLAVIRSITELRFMSGSQLGRMHGDGGLSASSRSRVMRRELSRLVALDCLVRLPRRVGGGLPGSEDSVYRLGLAGQRIAIHHGWLSAARTRMAPVPGSLFVAHALAVADVHIQFVEAERSGRLELLERNAEPVCWRSLNGIGSFARASQLKPDSFIRFGLGDYEHSAFIEVDMGTEGSRTIQRKLSTYAAYHRSGIEQERFGVFPKVPWLTTTPSRIDFLEAEIGQLSKGGRGLFGVGLVGDAVVALTGQQSTTPEA